MYTTQKKLHTHAHTDICVLLKMYTHTRRHIYTQIDEHTFANTDLDKPTKIANMCINAQTNTRTHTLKQTCIHTTHTHRQTHTHTHTYREKEGSLC